MNLISFTMILNQYIFLTVKNSKENKAVGTFINILFHIFSEFKTIEDLIKYKLELTETAIKELSL